LADLKKELSEQLSDMDRDLLNLLFAAYDNRNLLTWLSDKEAALHPAGISLPTIGLNLWH